MDQKKAQKIAKGLMALIDGKEQKRIKAECERSYIIAHINNDLLPQTNRVDWLKQATTRLKQFLINEATAFNERYPDDEMLIQDWLDLLSTVRAQIFKSKK